jgi:uncharacterized GH25 family protein
MRPSRSTLLMLLGGVLTLLAAWWIVRPRELPDLLALRPVERVPLPLELEGLPSARTRATTGSHRIVGTVTRDGRPARADIICAPLSRAWFYGVLVLAPRSHDGPAAAARPHLETRSGADGRFEVSGLHVGPWHVLARAADGAVAEETVDVEDVDLTRCDLALVPAPHSLSGRVSDTQGRPWGTRIEAVMPLLSDQGGLAVSSSEVDAQGRFRLDGLPARAWFLRVTGPGVRFALVLGARTPLADPIEVIVPLPDTVAAVQVLAAGDRRPIAGASVEAVWLREQVAVVQSAECDAEGRASLAVGTPCTLTASAAGYVPEHVELARPAATPPAASQEIPPTTIVLRRMSRVVGRVTRLGTCEPVPGLTVRLRARGDHRATTGPDGRYVLDDVPPGTWSILVTGAGWASAGLGLAQRQGWNPLLVEVLDGSVVTRDLAVEPAGRVTGRVLDPDGQMVSGAEVWLFPAWDRGGSGHMPSQLMRTAADGQFTFDGVPVGTWTWLRAESPEGVFTRAEPAPMAVTAVVCDLHLPRARWIEVEVRGANDELLPEAELEVERMHFPNLEATTGTEGRTRLGPITGEREVVVRAAGHVSTTVPMPSGATLLVRLERGQPLAGVVVDAAGAPVAGARVSASNRDSRSSLATLTTDAEGRFSWPAVDDGSWSVGAAHHLGAVLRQTSLDAVAGTTDLVLALEEPDVESPAAAGRGRVLVRVTDALGHEVTSFSGAVLQGGKLTEFEAGGPRKHVWLPTGGGAATYRVIVWGARDERGIVQGPRVAGPFAADVTTVEVTVPPGLALAGRIEGLPHGLERGALIEAFPEGDEWDWSEFLGVPAHELGTLEHPEQESLTARTHADGSFALGGLADFSFALVARLPPGWIQDELVVADPGDIVTLRARRGLDVVLTVVDEDGAPIAGARVSARSLLDGERHEEALANAHLKTSDEKTDAQGRAHLRGLRPGERYRLSIRPTREDEPPYEVAAFPHERSQWAPTDERIVLERAHVIAGVVQDRAGAPVPGARLALRGVAVNRRGEEKDSAISDREGRFKFDRLKQGTYVVWAAASERELADEPPPDAVTLPTGTRDAVFRVDAGGTLELAFARREPEVDREIVVHAWDGAAWVEVRSESETLGGGPFVMRGLERGRRHRVWIPPDSSDPRYVLVEVADVDAGPVRVEYQRGARVRVLGPDGARLRDVAVLSAESTEGLRMRFLSRPIHALAGLPPGRWTVHARDAERRTWEATLDVGTSDLDVRLAPR